MLDLSKNISDSSDFFSSIETLRRMFKRYGFEVPGYRAGDIKKFENLSAQQRMDAVNTLKNYVYIYEGAVKEEILPYNEAKFLWYSLRKWQYTPSSDLFDKIEEDDFIEVYNIENIQIHRSFNYFRLSSYSLADIFTKPWTDLYDRDVYLEKQIVGIVEKIFKGEITNTVFSNLDVHYIRESLSNEKRVYKVYHKYFSPLKDANGNQTAFVVLSKAENSNEDEFIASRKRHALDV